jgi:hypothetical protein
MQRNISMRRLMQRDGENDRNDKQRDLGEIQDDSGFQGRRIVSGFPGVRNCGGRECRLS